MSRTDKGLETQPRLADEARFILAHGKSTPEADERADAIESVVVREEPRWSFLAGRSLDLGSTLYTIMSVISIQRHPPRLASFLEFKYILSILPVDLACGHRPDESLLFSSIMITGVVVNGTLTKGLLEQEGHNMSERIGLSWSAITISPSILGPIILH